MLKEQLTVTRIVLLLLSIATLAGTLSWSLATLAYEADAFQAGQWWRPFSAWITQLNLRHWILNQWGIVVMVILLPKRLSWWQWTGFVVMWLVTSMALAMSDYSNYVGLSGLLYGWLIWSAFLSPFYTRWIKLIFIGALSIKVFSENGWLPLPQSEWVGSFIQARVAHESHLWGLLSGFLVIAVTASVQQFRSTPARHD
jgi:rhomboid family GlyGly-CTERM serine protease